MFRKSAICSTANKLTTQGYSRPKAFVIAWAMAKGQETKVTGTTYGNRQTALERLTRYAPEEISFSLVPEPKNQYDENAVAVMVSVNGSRDYKIGYVPAASAPLVSAILNNGTSLKTQLKAIVGGWAEGLNYGLRLSVSL